MKQYYTTQITETKSVRIPMVNSMEPEVALMLGALLAVLNPALKDVLETRANEYLGIMLAYTLEGEDIDLASEEVSNLIKMICGDLVSSVFASLDQLNAVMDEKPEEPDAEESESEA
jgi:hypothetical protein